MKHLLAITLGLLPSVAQADEALLLLQSPGPIPMISYATIGRLTAINPVDVFEIEISESGGITDIFVRLSSPASAELANWTTLAEGNAMTVSLCGEPVQEVDDVEINTSGTLYIPNITFVQADALRSVWHGRETCASLPPEMFSTSR